MNNPPYQQRYLDALTALEDARADAEMEERRMRFAAHGRQERMRGFGEGEHKTKKDLTNPLKMALISGFHKAIIHHFIHDDGGERQRAVIHALNQKLRDYLEQMQVNASADVVRPDGYTVTVTMPRQTFHIHGFSPSGRLDARTEKVYSEQLVAIIDEYNSPPAPRVLTEREEYEAYAKRMRDRQPGAEPPLSITERYTR